MELLVALVVMVLASANPKLLLDPLALLEHLAPLDLRANLELPVTLALPADPDPKDLLVSMALQDSEVPLVNVARTEVLEPLVDQDSLELREKLDLTEHLVATVAQEPLAEMVSMEPPDLLDPRVKLVHLVRLWHPTNPDLLVPLVPLVKMELLASQVALDPLDPKDLKDQSDLPVDLAAMDSLEALALKEKLEPLASLEPLARMVYPAHQADNPAHLAHKDLKDHLALTALLAKMVSLAVPVLQAKTDSPVDLASQVKKMSFIFIPLDLLLTHQLF